MIDTGLLISGVAIAVVAWLVARWTLPAAEGASSAVTLRASDALDVLLWSGMAGLLTGRAAAVLLDDPDSLRTLRTYLIIRGGVDMWPGAAVAAVVLAVTLRRRKAPVLLAAAAMTPVAVAAYAAFEGTCLVRGGCYGPRSTIGLRPEGLSQTMVPMGVVVAVALGLTALVLVRHHSWPAPTRVLVGLAAVSTLRSLASIWLPRIGDALTRQHRESIVVMVLSVAGLLSIHLTSRTRSAP